MPQKRTARTAKPIEQYTHTGKDRANNPPVGLVTPETDREPAKQIYNYDPHLDPQLNWAGKAERASFDVPTISLHVHERIDPRTIVEAVRRKPEQEAGFQPSLFANEQTNLPLFKAVEFYKHRHNWANRLIAGDSLLVMNSLLMKEGMAGGVQMIYFDPPYGIKYGSNFQPFVNKRDVKDGKDEDLTSEPEMLKAFRDTWELGIHSYLTYLRDRLLLARELLHESGSIFVQISDENVHLVRNLLDEVFGKDKFISQILFQKTGYLGGNFLDSTYDYIIWYGKDKTKTKFRQILTERNKDALLRYNYVELKDGTSVKLTREQLEGKEPFPEGKRWRDKSLLSDGETKGDSSKDFEFEERIFKPNVGKHWSTTVQGLERLRKLNRIICFKDKLNFKSYLEDFPLIPSGNIWDGMMIGTQLSYVVETSTKPIERCMLMTTDPSDLVLDITCGSGTTAYVAEQWGRRWITCDTSRVALALAKQRLMTASFDYYQLANPQEGIASGFKYKTVPHVTLKSIANNEPLAQETLYDQPLIDRTKGRVTSPFTVEAVPAPAVQMLQTNEFPPQQRLCQPMRRWRVPANRCVKTNGAANFCVPACADDAVSA